MHTFVRTAFVIAVVVSAVACKKASASHAAKPTSAECDKLIDHKADILAGSGASKGAKDAARVVLVKSETTSGWCRDMDKSQYDCEMKSTTKAAMDACQQ